MRGEGEPPPTERVSILIPCRNEERFIGEMLRTVVGQDYPGDLVEILVLDGRSDDATRDVVSAFAERNPNVRVIDNPGMTAPAGLNRGIAMASGDIIVRMDAHAEYPRNYVSRLARVLRERGADNVGGVWDVRPGGDGLVARTLASAASSRFGVGAARYRHGAAGIEEVDTVPFGCYRRDVFERIGGFDEELARNQDDELNARLRKRGGTILLVPDVEIVYYARPTLRRTCQMFYQYGLYKPLVVKKIGYPATLRQLFPPAFLLALIALALGGAAAPVLWWGMAALLGVYGAAATWFAAQQARSDREWRYLLTLPPAFFCIHASYGWGYLVGAAWFLVLGRSPPHRPLALSR